MFLSACHYLPAKRPVRLRTQDGKGCVSGLLSRTIPKPRKISFPLFPPRYSPAPLLCCPVLRSSTFRSPVPPPFDLSAVSPCPVSDLLSRRPSILPLSSRRPVSDHPPPLPLPSRAGTNKKGILSKVCLLCRMSGCQLPSGTISPISGSSTCRESVSASLRAFSRGSSQRWRAKAYLE